MAANPRFAVVCLAIILHQKISVSISGLFHLLLCSGYRTKRNYLWSEACTSRELSRPFSLFQYIYHGRVSTSVACLGKTSVDSLRPNQLHHSLVVERSPSVAVPMALAPETVEDYSCAQAYGRLRIGLARRTSLQFSAVATHSNHGFALCQSFDMLVSRLLPLTRPARKKSTYP